MNVTFLGATGNSIYSVDLNVTEDYYRELKSLLKGGAVCIYQNWETL